MSASSATISPAAIVTIVLRPSQSAAAPLGISNRTIVTAQATLSRLYCSSVMPRSINRMLSTG